MAFYLIDMDKWPRKDHFHYYSHVIPTNYQVNVDMDVTQLRKACLEKKLRFYPAMIYAIMRAVNAHPQFRMAKDKEGRIGYYDICYPSYTIFHKDDHTFSDIWTVYSQDFREFYAAAVDDMEQYKDVKGARAKPGKPACTVPVSAVPWLNFTSMAHDTAGPRDMYLPIFTYGQYHTVVDPVKTADGYSFQESLKMTFSMMINHAAADGWHTSLLLHEIQDNCNTCRTWMAGE